VKRRPAARELLPLARGLGVSGPEPTGDAFDPAWIDFERGIRVGNLEPHERITQILRWHLERRYGVRFITDRWGRGTHWQWICWVPLPNRQAKPVSHDVNFGCAKLFISVDREERVFQCGLQIERGYVEADRAAGWRLARDWDWHRFLRACAAGGPFEAELRRLAREGFAAAVTGGSGTTVFDRRTFTGAAEIRRAARRQRPDEWAGFQLYYPMPEREVQASRGRELVDGIVGALVETVPAMNLCMQVPLPQPPAARGPLP
jgi:hypothetical protein